MNIDDKINRIIENGEIKKRLCEIGVCGTMGPRGCKGDVGPTGPSYYNPTAYSAILFMSFQDIDKAGTVNIYTKRMIPGVSSDIEVQNNLDINVLRTGIFEITLCFE